MPLLLMRRVWVTGQLTENELKYDDPVFEKLHQTGFPSQVCHGIHQAHEGVRTLRKGYVYVYLVDDDDRLSIESYEVSPQGYLRKRALDAPMGGEPEELPKACIDNGHGVGASFLFVDTVKYRIAWIAFAHDAWPERVRNRYKQLYEDGEQAFRDRFRMVVLRDRSTLKNYGHREYPEGQRFINGTDGQGWGDGTLADIPEYNLEYYDYDGSIMSTFGFYTKASQSRKLREAIKNYMQLPQYAEALKDGVPVVELDDAIGDVLEANFWRNALLVELNQWMGEKTRAYKCWTSREAAKIWTHKMEAKLEEIHETTMSLITWDVEMNPDSHPVLVKEAELCEPVENLTEEQVAALPPSAREDRQKRIEYQAERKRKLRERMYEGNALHPTKLENPLKEINSRMDQLLDHGQKVTFDLAYAQWYNKYVGTIRKVSELYVRLIKKKMFSEVMCVYDYADVGEEGVTEDDVRSALAYAKMIGLCLRGGAEDLPLYEELTRVERLKSMNKSWVEVPLEDKDRITAALWFDLKRDLAQASTDEEVNLSRLYNKAVTFRRDWMGQMWDETLNKVLKTQEDARQAFANLAEKTPQSVIEHNDKKTFEQMKEFWTFAMNVNSINNHTTGVMNFVKEMQGEVVDVLFSADLSASMQMVNFANPPYKLDLGINRTSNLMLVGYKDVAPIEFNLNMTDFSAKEVGARARTLFMRASRAESTVGRHHSSFNSNASSFHLNGVVPDNIDVNAVYGVRINVDSLPPEIQSIRSAKDFQEKAYAYAMDPKNSHLFETVHLSETDFVNGKFDPEAFAKKFILPAYTDEQLRAAAEVEVKRAGSIRAAKVTLTIEVVNIVISLMTLNSLGKSLERAISREKEYLLLDYYLEVGALLGSIMSAGECSVKIYTGGIDRQVLSTFSAKGVVDFLSRGGHVLSAITSAVSAYQMSLRNTEAFQRQELPLVNEYYNKAMIAYSAAAVMSAGTVIFLAAAPVTAPIVFIVLITAKIWSAKADAAKKDKFEKWLERCYFGRMETLTDEKVVQLTEEQSKTGSDENWLQFFSRKWDHLIFQNIAGNYINAIWSGVNLDLLPYMKIKENPVHTYPNGIRSSGTNFYSIVDLSLDLPFYHPEKSAYDAFIFVQLTNKDAQNNSLYVKLSDFESGFNRAIHQPVNELVPLVSLGRRPHYNRTAQAPWDRPPAYCSPARSKDASNEILENAEESSGVMSQTVYAPTTQEEWKSLESQRQEGSEDKLINRTLKGSWTLDLDGESFALVGLRVRFWPEKDKADVYMDLEMHEYMAFDPQTEKCYT